MVVESATAGESSRADQFAGDAGARMFQHPPQVNPLARAGLVLADDGIGIDAVHIPRLTERFYRVDRGRSRETGGTGLGLAIVKHVTTRHHGELVIESEPGRGSRFTLRFPPARVRPG